MGKDYTKVFAPVARMETVRLIIVIAAQLYWKIHQMDFKSAFLNGVLEEEVYIQQPVRYIVQGQEQKALRLNKALYGLKQAPRTWNATLDRFLQNQSFVRCPHEYALYVKKEKGSLLLVCVYVDDIIFTGDDERILAGIKKLMKQHFEMTDLGYMSYYLGISVQQEEGRIFMSQTHYIKKVLEQFGMLKCSHVSTPITAGASLDKLGIKVMLILLYLEA
ncbi:hypothetical protein Dimus_039534 [Dionaea muscipula]